MPTSSSVIRQGNLKVHLRWIENKLLRKAGHIPLIQEELDEVQKELEKTLEELKLLRQL